MKKLLLAFILIDCGAFAQSVQTAGAWLPVNIKWQHAPPEIDPKLESGSATVLYFDEQHRFALVSCVINRVPGRYTTVSAGDGQAVSYGSWDGHLPGRAKYRLISQSVEPIGETLPGPWQEKKLGTTPTGYLTFQGKLYRRAKLIEPSLEEFLPKNFAQKR